MSGVVGRAGVGRQAGVGGQHHGKRIFVGVTYRIRVGGQSQKFNPIGHAFCFFGAAKWEWTKALWVCIHECKARLSACATLP